MYHRFANTVTQATLDAIKNRYHPAGWLVKESRRLSGECDYSSKTIRVPFVRDGVSLHQFLHECAHAVFHCSTGHPPHREEYEAERWAIETARQNGLRVPRSLVVDCKVYVRSHIYRDRARGIPIQKHVERWAHS